MAIFVLKAHSSLVLADMPYCEKTNKRKHSMISKKSKYAEVDSDEDKDEDVENSDSDSNCER